MANLKAYSCSQIEECTRARDIKILPISQRFLTFIQRSYYITGIIRLKSANSNIFRLTSVLFAILRFFVSFCAVSAQSKNLFRNSENTAQNLTGESQYRIVYTGEKENENLHNQKEVFTYLEQRERCGYLGINKIGSRRS